MKLIIHGVSKLYEGKVWGLKDVSLSLELGVLGLPYIIVPFPSLIL